MSIDRLLPTPLSTDGEHGGPNQRDGKGKPRLAMVARLLRTPCARDCHPSKPDNHANAQIQLAHQVQNWSAFQSPSSPPASPVSPHPLPGSEEARMMTVGSGRKLCASLATSGPIGACLRILLESSVWHSEIVYLRWTAKPLMVRKSLTVECFSGFGTASKQWATQSGRWLYQLAVSTPSTRGTGSSLLPTPTSRDHKDGTSTENVPENALLGRAVHPSKERGSLNPEFVTWMMGFPEGYLDIPIGQEATGKRRNLSAKARKAE